MTFVEAGELLDKYCLDMNGNMCVIYHKFPIGTIKIHRSTNNGTEEIAFIFVDPKTFKSLTVLNPIAAENIIKNMIFECKKIIAENRERKMNEDFG